MIISSQPVEPPLSSPCGRMVGTDEPIYRSITSPRRPFGIGNSDDILHALSAEHCPMKMDSNTRYLHFLNLYPTSMARCFNPAGSPNRSSALARATFRRTQLSSTRCKAPRRRNVLNPFHPGAVHQFFDTQRRDNDPTSPFSVPPRRARPTLSFCFESAGRRFPSSGRLQTIFKHPLPSKSRCCRPPRRRACWPERPRWMRSGICRP